MTHTVNLGISNKKISQIKNQVFPKTKTELTLFAFLVTKSVDILFEQSIDYIK